VIQSQREKYLAAHPEEAHGTPVEKHWSTLIQYFYIKKFHKSSVKSHEIGAVNFEYGNFEKGNFDTNLSSKNRRLVCSKTSDGNFEFSIENGNF